MKKILLSRNTNFKQVRLCLLWACIASVHLGCMTRNTCVVDVTSSCNNNTGVVYTLETTADEAYKQQVELVLQRRGFIPVALTGQSTSEISIRLDATMQGPFRKTYTYSTPVFALRTNCCSCPPDDCRCRGHQNQTSYEIVDSIKRTGSYLTYTRTLKLVATDLSTGKNAWETTATSTGRTGDLNQVFPVLLIASEPYIATTKSKSRVLMKLNNPAVLALTAETPD